MSASKKPEPNVSPRLGFGDRLRLVARQASAWLTAHRNLVVPVVAVGLLGCSVLAALMLGTARKVVKNVERQREHVTLEMAIDAYDEGYYANARDLAEKLRPEDLQDDEQGGKAYVLGAVLAHEADELWGEEQRARAILAARRLQESQRDGWPPGREGEGHYLLGKCLAMGGDKVASRAVLEEALAFEPPNKAAIYLLLTRVWLEGDHADLQKALEYNALHLASAHLGPHDRHAGLLEQAQIYFKLKEVDNCLKTLDEIPLESIVGAEAALLRGRLMLRAANAQAKQIGDKPTPEQTDALRAQYEQVITVLRRAQLDPLAIKAIRQSMYLIGVCYLHLGDQQAALAQFERARQVYLDTREGLAAGLQEADLLLSASRDDEAVAIYCQVLSAIPADVKFANPFIPSQKFRARILEAFDHYQSQGDIPRAVQIAEHLTPLIPQARAIEILAETYRKWAQRKLAEAEKTSGTGASQLRTEGRALMRKAARTFGELARLNFSTRSYPDDMWRSAECFLEGHQFTQAVAAYDEYLKYELRRRRPQALVNMGECYLALGKLDEALAALGECILFHSQDAASYEARLLAAKVHLEKGETAEAESLLKENLSGDYLTPESQEWRDSLFAYGSLLATEGRYNEAIERLEEAITRYPNTPRAIEARYLTAEAYRQLAKIPQEKLQNDSNSTTRLVHLKEVNQALEAAIAQYEDLQTALNARQEQTQLSAIEQATLRNSYFAVGAALFDMGRYEDSIRAYSIATNRYQHAPEVLEAFVQIATCYRRLNKPIEARGAVQQAKVVLNRIKPEAPFTQTTNYTRTDWVSLLDWLSTM